jgi:hypothetical protein
MSRFEAAVAGGIPIIKSTARGAVGESHQLACRHHQRHQQLHPHRNAREGAVFR